MRKLIYSMGVSVDGYVAPYFQSLENRLDLELI